MNNQIPAALRQGMSYFQSGRLKEAEGLFARILEISPRNIDALQLLGLTRFQMGRAADAEQLLRKAIRLDKGIPKLHYNLGHVLEVQGKLKEALAAFRAAVKLDPKDEWALVNLGVVYGKMNRLEEGVTACQNSLKLNPGNVSALSNMGQFLWREGRTEEAKKVLEEALSLQPEFPQALSNLGALLFTEGELDLAEKYLRRARSVLPNEPEILTNLAGVLLSRREVDEALQLGRKVVSLSPNNPEALFNLGRVLEKAEQWEEVISVYYKGLALQPRHADAMSGLARAHMTMGEFDQARKLCQRIMVENPHALSTYSLALSLGEPETMGIKLERVEREFQKANEDKDEKRHLAFTLAKYLEKQGQYDKAFGYLSDGNRIKRSSFEYEIGQEGAFFNSIKEHFSKELIGQKEVQNCSHERPIFILGMPRSGTTLTEQILASHSQVFGAGELDELRKLLKEYSDPSDYRQFPQVVAQMGDGLLEQMGLRYLEKLRRLSPDSPRVTDKMPHNFLHLGVIRILFPNAKVIHCRRDPVDNCLSIFKQDFKSIHKYAYDLEELGRYYLLYRDLMTHWANVLPEGYVFDLDYEAMVADQEGMSRKLLEFCDLPWEDGCLEFHKTRRAVRTASQSQVRKKIYSGSVKLWQQYEEQLQPLIRVLRKGGAIE